MTAEPRAVGEMTPRAPDPIPEVRNFRLLWGGQAISLLGNELTKLAIPLLALGQLHASSAQVGLLRASGTAPTLVIMLFVGVWVDRLRRRPLLIASNLFQAAVLMLLTALALSGSLSFVMLATAALALGAAGVVFEVAYPSFIPTVVPTERLPSANGRLFGAQSVAEAAGPGLAGVLVAWFGAGWVLLVDAVSFVVSAVTVLAIRVRESVPAPSEGRRVLGEIKTGMRALLGHSLLRATVLAAGLYNFWESSLATVFLVHAVRGLGISEATLGLILGGGSVGAIVGTAVSAFVVRRYGLGPTLAVNFTAGCLLPLLLLLPNGNGLGTVVAFTVIFFSTTFCIALYSVQALTVRQAATPDHMRGRVLASGWLFILGSIPLGALLGGFLGGLLTPWTALAVSALGLPMAMLFLLPSPVPRLTGLPAVEHQYWERFE
ncbi:MFS transporter [Streptomyces sp. HK10]|uniref:MFS transporter n=1 Tax=Streptomyces sp. HK10 TaxID=3373255 RepID=UPI003748C4AE